MVFGVYCWVKHDNTVDENGGLGTISVSLGGSAGPDKQDHVDDPEERGWLPRHCRGDRQAFPELLQTYRAPVYSYLVRTGMVPGVRDDLFQDIFLKIHQAASAYQPDRPLRPWIFTIVANTVRNHLRDQNIRQTVSLTEIVKETADPKAAADNLLEIRELTEWLEGAINTLPLRQREVLVMTTIDGLRQRDVATALQLPLNSVKTYLRRARLTLVQALERRENRGGSNAEL